MSVSVFEMTAFDYTQLYPQLVWKHFHTLCVIPRPSKHEQAIRDYLVDWARQKQLESYVDTVGNLIIRKAATLGMEQVPGVILQGHLDMVTQANRGTQHDFFKDPIQAIVQDGWLISPNTTLGADNGIGVALALAVLESTDIQHGPIEVLLTVDEEAGMSGARLLEKGLLKGKWLFNIDTEEWGELYLGCAGSIDLEVSSTIKTERLDGDFIDFEIMVTGLIGGHSGIDIHLGRGNANVILVDFLQQYLSQLDGCLTQFIGGTARNAIPREATAKIVIPTHRQNDLVQLVVQAEVTWQAKLKGIDDLFEIIVKPIASAHFEVMSQESQHQWLSALANCPYGVAKMGAEIEGVVETSNNIGIVELTANQGKAVIMIRSLVNQDALHFADNLQEQFEKHNLSTHLTPLISGWAPNPNSAALKCLQQAYLKVFNIEPKLKVIHAGLECGIIAEHYPHLEMVSFGPDIRGAHAPGERVDIQSVEKCWQLLVSALASVR